MDLPLLDDVNLLIEKEKTLLALQVIERERIAEEWKSKYDNLLSNVASSTMEVRTDTKLPLPVLEISEISSFLPLDVNCRCIDLSGAQLDNVHVANLVSFASKSAFSKDPNAQLIFDFSNCGIGDKLMDELLFLFGLPGLGAMDLSHNSFSNICETQIFEHLRNRRDTPQYMLFHGNSALSESSKSFGNIFHCLTDNTWGISLTLQDVVSSHLLFGRDDTKRADAPPTHQLCCHEFLRQLNESIVSSKSSSAAPSVFPPKSSKALALSGRHGLHLLAVLGLMHAQLSRKSIAQLKKTMALTMPTLTDLDLSFAFVGVSGAEMLSGMLGHRDCQLVRLCLAGGLIGDRGCVSMGKALMSNRSLTALDLRSNSITGAGVRVLLADCLLAPGAAGSVLWQLDLRNNSIAPETVVQMEKELSVLCGMCLQVVWTNAAASVTEAVQAMCDVTGVALRVNNNKKLSDYSSMSLQLPFTLHGQAHMSSCPLDVAGQCCLSRLDLAKMLQPILRKHESLLKLLKLQVTFNMRPEMQRHIATGSSRNSKNIQQFPLSSDNSCKWSVSIYNAKGKLVYSHEELLPCTSCHGDIQDDAVARAENPCSWTTCSTDVSLGDLVCGQDLYKGYKLDLCATPVSRYHHISAFELSSLNISCQNIENNTTLNKCTTSNVDNNRAVSKDGVMSVVSVRQAEQLARALPTGHSVLAVLPVCPSVCLPGPGGGECHDSVSVEFGLALVPSGSRLASGVRVDVSSLCAAEPSLGYTWRVTVLRGTPKRGVVCAGEGRSDDSDDTSNCMSKSYSVSIDSLTVHHGDVVMLSGAVTILGASPASSTGHDRKSVQHSGAVSLVELTVTDHCRLASALQLDTSSYAIHNSNIVL